MEEKAFSTYKSKSFKQTPDPEQKKTQHNRTEQERIWRNITKTPQVLNMTFTPKNKKCKHQMHCILTIKKRPSLLTIDGKRKDPVAEAGNSTS